MNYEVLILQKEAGVATISLNRPDKRNALNEKLGVELTAAIAEVSEDEAVKAVVITGAGPGFCAGGDLTLPLFGVTGDIIKMRKFLEKTNLIPLGLRNMRKPVIAAVNGAAVGFGASLAMACDIIIASEAAKFGQVWFNIGYHPDTGSSYFLPRLVGVAKACELIFTGKVIDAKEAERIGMVNQVVPADALLKTAKELAAKLAAGPAVAMGLAKSCIYHGAEMTLEQALDYETEAALLTLHTADQKEGVKAFMEKRPPKFQGK